ncbi:hypothetical protein TIFTF001_027851 [Ficus carica]|uniref:Uncharacterized protein n=1 Tax=Ficus carica TaxID=3494 RepID=A0AA88J0B8_FICCA|nr:hypothetical protein TIFTF001_027851 [Ficus carica]
MTLVRGFYANAKEHRNYKTKVRGIVVKFDEVTINRHLGLMALKEDDLTDYTKKADMQERALAPHAIAKGMRMNVRAIINATILDTANINNVALSFPSLLTKLFEKAGMNTTDNSVCKVIWALDPYGIVCIWNN